MIAVARQRLREWDPAYQFLLVVTLFNIVDFLTTTTIISEKGMLAEYNQLLLYMMQAMDSVWAIFLFKCFVLINAAILMWIFYKPEQHRRVTPVLKFVLIPYVIVSIWNFTQVLT